MSLTIASPPDAALLPAAAPAAPTEQGVVALRKALDHDELMGRAAVRLIEAAAPATAPPDAARGALLSRTA